MEQVLLIEPFYGGSHRQLADLLLQEFGGDLYTLPATKWHWRMRVSALYFAQTIPKKDTYRTLFASGVLNLCELISLRQDFKYLNKVLYFHENQLIYPVRKQKERDFQYGYNQILSCLVADVVLFNSHFNMDSFLKSVDSFLKLIPDHKPQGISEQIQPKCSVLYFPLQFPFTLKQEEIILESKVMPTSEDNVPEAQQTPFEATVVDILTSVQPGDDRKSTAAANSSTELCDSLQNPQKPLCIEKVCTCSFDNSATVSSSKCRTPLHIVWPHRCIVELTHQHAHNLIGDETVTALHVLWKAKEHDKGPEEFCSVLMKLMDANVDFVVSILGEHTNDIPECFKALFPKLGPRLLHREYVPRDIYWQILQSADVVVSTAKHEFYGVAMLEAVICGCYPLCPNRLVYPEIYPGECLYNTEQQLFKRVRRFCQRPDTARAADIRKQVRVSQFCWTVLKKQYRFHLFKEQ